MLALALIYIAFLIAAIFIYALIRAESRKATDYPDSYDEDLHFLREAERRQRL